MAEILPKWRKTLINKSKLQEVQGHLGVVLELFAFVSSSDNVSSMLRL
jgi:hypothetical protein